uniref:GG16499 n=1 Tax=Drosophila erecta TaxID=7220 RepID=B3P2W5_DROER
MFATSRNNFTEGPLCHSTPRSEKGESQLDSRCVAKLPVSIYGSYISRIVGRHLIECCAVFAGF